MSFISSCENENDYETTEKSDESGRAREKERIEWRKNRLERSQKVKQNVQQTDMNELHLVHGGLKLEP